MSIWATRLYLKDETAPFKYDHYNRTKTRAGELEIAWPPGDYSSLRFCLNDQEVLLDREQAEAVLDVLVSFTGSSPLDLATDSSPSDLRPGSTSATLPENRKQAGSDTSTGTEQDV